MIYILDLILIIPIIAFNDNYKISTLNGSIGSHKQSLPRVSTLPLNYKLCTTSTCPNTSTHSTYTRNFRQNGSTKQTHLSICTQTQSHPEIHNERKWKPYIHIKIFQQMNR